MEETIIMKIKSYLKMNKILNLISYYILLLLGLIITSWIIWSRFLRTRTIRDIPDMFFSEYRFWILLYICCIYLYVVKNLVKPKEGNIILLELSNLLFKPLSMLDHALKYNKYIKPYYDKTMFRLVAFLDDNLADKKITIFIYVFQILPRIILVTFLLVDTFWFHKLEILYKIILIGLLPFLFRYFNYSLKDLYERWVLDLEDTYNFVDVHEKGYEYQRMRSYETKAIHHSKMKTIREYIDIKYQNVIDNMFDADFPYIYVGSPYAQTTTTIAYYLKKTGIDITSFNKDEKRKAYESLRMEDYNQIDKMFHMLMEKILQLRMFLETLDLLKEMQPIKYIKIIVFSLYFICWSYILIKNYYHYPVEFNLFKYLISNVVLYLMFPNDIISGWELHSFNENLITIESIRIIVHAIWKKLI